MIYFDNKALMMVWEIKRSKRKGVTWGRLMKKYGTDYANIFSLENLNLDGYIITDDEFGSPINFRDWNHSSNATFRSYTTVKGNELVETRLFDFWKWIVPTVISVAALIVSALTA